MNAPCETAKAVGGEVRHEIFGALGHVVIILPAARHAHIPFVAGALVIRCRIERARFFGRQPVPRAQIDLKKSGIRHIAHERQTAPSRMMSIVLRARGKGLQKNARSGRMPASRARIFADVGCLLETLRRQRRVDSAALEASLDIGFGFAVTAEIKREPGAKLSGIGFDDGDVGRVFGFHADDVIAAIDMQLFARHRAAEIGKQEQRAVAHFVDRHASGAAANCVRSI